MKNNNIEDKFYNSKKTFGIFGPKEIAQAEQLMDKISRSLLILTVKNDALRNLHEDMEEAYEQARQGLNAQDIGVVKVAERNFSDAVKRIKTI